MRTQANNKGTKITIGPEYIDADLKELITVLGHELWHCIATQHELPEPDSEIHIFQHLDSIYDAHTDPIMLLKPIYR